MRSAQPSTLALAYTLHYRRPYTSDASKAFDKQLALPQSNEHAQYLMEQDVGDALGDNSQLSPQIAEAIQALWQDPTVRDITAHANEIQLNDRCVGCLHLPLQTGLLTEVGCQCYLLL